MKTYSRKNSSYLKKAFIASNFNEMCRLCLSEVDMVLTPIIQNHKISYKEWIHYSVDVLIEEGDGMPPNICEECLAMVEQTYLFKKKCKASDSKLREHLELLDLEDGKLNDIRFNDVSEDHKILFMKEHPSENKCDKSNSVDSGGTEGKPPLEADPVKDVIILDTPEENPQLKEENETPLVELQGKVFVNKVQRYILKGEKRADDQEEDLTVCEVIPLDVKTDDSIPENESLELYSNMDCGDENGELSESSGGRIQEIYRLWDNEEEGEVVVEVGEKKDKGVMILDVLWEDNSDKQIPKQNKGVLEVDVEENGVVQMHRVYTNKNQIEIVETMPEKKNFRCFVCTEFFPTSSELKDHLGRSHREVSDAAFCEICGKSFTCTNSLKRHMAIHTGFKPYKCKICGREFSQGSILKRHVLTHENLKPFNCHICNKGYTQKMNLLSHLKNHGFRTGAESFRCKLCSKSFVHQSGLSRHVKLHKGVRFLCVHCKKSFGDASALARHVKAIHQQQVESTTL